MSSIGSPSPFFLAGKKAYQVERSVRFNGQYETNAQQFRRTGTSTVSTYTISMWAKNCGVGTGVYRLLFSIGQENDANAGWVGMSDSDVMYFQGGNGTYSTSTQVFRDPSAWFHFLISVNSNNFTVYVNGTSIKTGTIRSLDTSTNGIRIGVNYGNYYPWDGYIADYYLIDGQALTPSSFTETNAETGQLVPKLYTGSFGTEGAHLTFEDNSGITATTLGKDSSGNGNNYTPSGDWSVSAGAGNDSVEDTPTNNWCTLNSLAMIATGNVTPSNGNLNASFGTVSGGGGIASSFVVRTGKWYWETTITAVSGASIHIGILDENIAPFAGSPFYEPGVTAESYAYQNNGTKYNNNTNTSYGASYTTNDVIGIALDLDNGTITFYKNNVSQGQAFSSLTGGFSPAYGDGSSAGTHSISANFGQQGFTYTPPTGYKALNSANLPDPTILLPNKHFDTLLWSGNATTSDRSITGLNFQPDWAWTKTRNQGYHHALFDSVRGANNILNSDQTFSENHTNGGKLASFDAPSSGSNDGGITWDYGTGNNDTRLWWNVSGKNYLSWNWNAGDTDGKTYIVKVHNFSGNNRYIFDDFQTQAVTLDLAEGGTYIFNMDDSSNASHPFSIGTAANGTVYTSGITYFLDGVSKTYSEYTSGFAAATTRRLHITVPASAPVLYYWCSVHSGMGGQINTNSTLGSSNFDGSIQSTAKANASAGFSIVSYTGNATSGATVGHGLGVATKVMIVKERGNTNNWPVYHAEIGNTKALYLDLTNDSGGAFTGAWNNTSPTSSVFSLGNSNETNRSSGNFIAYCFSEVAGYSKFGSYTGNGSSNGTFVFTGFRPAWVMVKRYDGGGQGWNIFDNKRNTFNLVDEFLIANSSNAEATGGALNLDFLSNGFKFRGVDGGSNTSGSDYIYLAFAESPFKNARAR